MFYSMHTTCNGKSYDLDKVAAEIFGDLISPTIGFTLKDDVFTKHIELPGIAKDRMSISIESGDKAPSIAISIVEDKEAHIPDAEKYIIKTDSRMDLEKLEATLKDGLLTLTVPKKEAKKIFIKVK